MESGFDEAILLTTQGKVCEASGMNVFLVRNGELITRAFIKMSSKALPANSVMTLAREMGIPVVERLVDKSELFIADEVFLSGTAAKVAPVKQIENFKMPAERPITTKIREKLAAITTNCDPDHKDWVSIVPLA